MANSLSSNITRKLIRKFLPEFEKARVLSRNVNTTLISNEFNPSSGDTVDIKRPHDYVSTTNSTGDLTSTNRSNITSGKATATVQDFRTVSIEYNRLERAIELDQLGKPSDLQSILGPMASRLSIDLEKDFANFASANAGLLSGEYGTAIGANQEAWDDVAVAGAVLEANGVPQDKMWNYHVNPFNRRVLASGQRSLGSGSDSLVNTAHERAMITENLAGMDVFTVNTLPTYSSAVGADRVGALDANPIVTYVGAKDTMTQALVVTSFQANLVINAGEVIQFTGINSLDKGTRDVIIDDTGSTVLFTAVVTATVTLDGSGEGTIITSGPAIFETGGAYNTVDAAPISGTVITLLGAASTTFQPNLFWHPDAFGIGFVNLPELPGLDNTSVTNDGISMRMAVDSDIITNETVLRVDILPAFAVYNPFFAGKSFGQA